METSTSKYILHPINGAGSQTKARARLVMDEVRKICMLVIEGLQLRVLQSTSPPVVELREFICFAL